MKLNGFKKWSRPEWNTVWIKGLLWALFTAAFFSFSGNFVENCKALVSYYGSAMHDPGTHILFSGFARLIRTLIPTHTTNGMDVFLWESALILFFSLVLLIPRVSIWVSAGAQLCLGMTWQMFHEFSHFGVAIESWAVIFIAMFLIQTARWQGTRHDYLATFLLSLVLGILPTMRQSTNVMIAVSAMIILGMVLCVGAAQLSRSRSQHRFFRFLIPVLILVASSAAIQGGIRALHVSQTKTAFNPHGTGFPLYASLGFGNNPYNIVWDDDGAMATGLLTEGKPWMLSPYGQVRLRQTWWERVQEDPLLLWRGMMDKGIYLIRYYFGRIEFPKIQGDSGPVRPSWWVTLATLGFMGAFIFCVGMLIKLKNDTQLIWIGVIAGLLASGHIVLLIIVPFYFGSSLTSLWCVMLMVAPGLASAPLENETDTSPLPHEIRTRALGILLGIGTLGLFLISLYTGFRWGINQKEARQLVAGEPMRQWHELNFRYAHRFNRLSIEDQQRIIDRWMSLENRSLVFKRDPSPVKQNLIFDPVLAIQAPTTLAVVARLSRDWEMITPSRVQGPRNSVLSIVKNTDDHPPILFINAKPDQFLKISDANWDGRYRMFCLPQKWGHEEGARFYHAAAFNFKDGSHVRGLHLELISGHRLVRGDLIK